MGASVGRRHARGLEIATFREDEGIHHDHRFHSRHALHLSSPRADPRAVHRLERCGDEGLPVAPVAHSAQDSIRDRELCRSGTRRPRVRVSGTGLR